MNVVARWPGGTHDSFIYRHSHLKEESKTGLYGNAWVLGRTYTKTFICNAIVIENVLQIFNKITHAYIMQS